MKLNFGLGLLFFLVFISCSSKKEQVILNYKVTDDLNNTFEFSKPPQRIISLAPNITEMIYDLNLDSCLVGNTIYCNFPEKAKSVEKIGDMLTFNFERIVALNPDLIFITVEGNTKDTYAKFNELGLKVFVSNPRNFEGIKKTYSDLGKIFNINTSPVINKWDSTVIKIKKETNSINKKAMYVVEITPIMLAGKNTFLNEYLSFCGLENIANDSKLNYPVFNREEILTRNPDFIIYPTDGSYTIEQIKKAYPEWKTLKAIKNNNVIFVDRDLYSRPGPRFVSALEDLFNQVRQKEEADQHHPK